MKIDETELIEFFGAAPVAEDPEEKEFFGSSRFEVTERDLKLSVSFGSYHGDMTITISSTGHDEPVLQAMLSEISEVRIQGREPRILEVVGKVRGATGNDPQLERRVAISLAPLKVTIED